MKTVYNGLKGLVVSLLTASALLLPAISVMATGIDKDLENVSTEAGGQAVFSVEANGANTIDWSTSIPVKAIEANGWGKVSISADGKSLTIDGCTDELDGMVVFCKASGDSEANSKKVTLSVVDKVLGSVSTSGELVKSVELSCTAVTPVRPGDIYTSGTTASKLTVRPAGIDEEGRITLYVCPNKGVAIDPKTDASTIHVNTEKLRLESAAVDSNGLLKVTLLPNINEEYKADDRMQLLFFNGVYSFKAGEAAGYNFAINNVTGAEDSATIDKGRLPGGIELRKFDYYGVHGTPTEDGIFETKIRLTTPANGDVKAQSAEAAITVIVASDHVHSYTASGSKFSCSCGDSFSVDSINVKDDHTHSFSKGNPDTSEAGYVKYSIVCSGCGASKEVRFAEGEHKDLDGDLLCDYCGSSIEAAGKTPEIEEPVVTEAPAGEVTEPVTEEKEEPTEAPAATKATPKPANNTKTPAKKANPLPIILIVAVIAGVAGFMFYKKKHKVVHYTEDLKKELEMEKAANPYGKSIPVMRSQTKEEKEEADTSASDVKEPVVTEASAEVVTEPVEPATPKETDVETSEATEEITVETTEDTAQVVPKEQAEEAAEKPKPVSGPLPAPAVIEIHTPKNN